MSETLTRDEVKSAREDHRCRRASLDQRRHQGIEEYLSRDWWAHFDGRYVLPDHWLRPRLARASSNRIDAITPSGGEAGSHSVFMKEEHLDKHNISHAALSSIQAGELAAIPMAERSGGARQMTEAFPGTGPRVT